MKSIKNFLDPEAPVNINITVNAGFVPQLLGFMTSKLEVEE